MLQVREIKTSSLQPWEDNPRLNNQAIDAVAKSIRSFGFNVPILCDQNLTIIAGHTRWKAAHKLAMEKVPVIVLEMTDAQRRAFAIADNKTADIADWDFPKLKEVLEKLRTEDVEIGNLGFSDEEIRRLILNEDNNENTIPEFNNTAVVTKIGDIYALGNHRLLCGDSRNKDSLLLLIEGESIDHIFGGPPYFNQRTYSHWQEYEACIADMKPIIQNCLDILKDGATCVWNIANG